MNQKALLLFVISVSVMSLLFLSGGVSYAYFSDSKVSKDAININTGNLVSNITYHPDINLKLKTFSDEYALKTKLYDEIKITNNTDYSIFYNIVATIDSNTQAYVNFSDIHVSLHEINGEQLSDPILGPISLSELPIYEKNDQNSFFDKYTLHFGSLDVKKEKKYAIRAWLDINNKDAYRNEDIVLNVATEIKPLKSKNFYSIKGIVTNPYGTPLSGAYVYLQNGTIMATSDENGQYELKGIPTGNYNLIAKYEDVEYKSSIQVEASEQVSVTPGEISNFLIKGLDDINETTIDGVTLMLGENNITIVK